MPVSSFPEEGLAPEAVFAEMEEARSADVDWRRGRLGLYVHYAGDDVLKVAKEAYMRFFSENALGRTAFPSLVKFESDVVDWTLGLFHAKEGAFGNITSGGTESIFLAMKTARDWARQHHDGGGRPNVVVPHSAHPAFNKAAHYLDVEVRRAPLAENFRASVEAMRARMDRATFMLVGSAPAFPHGVFDPLEEIAALASEHGAWMHVDACVGGYLSPFARSIGYPIPAFDFSVPGVTSISADLHKYGFTAKGASTIVFADAGKREHVMFDFTDWPRGAYSSPTFGGTRPGGAIAAAWAVMRYLGEEGYKRIATTVMGTRDRFIEGISAIKGLHVLGEPELSVVAYTADDIDIHAVADRMAERGWFVGRGVQPPCIHLGMITFAHAPIVDEYLRDLAEAVDLVRQHGQTSANRTATYG